MEITYAAIFVWPLLRQGGVQHSPAIKRLATRSLVATTGSLVTSLVNIGTFLSLRTVPICNNSSRTLLSTGILERNVQQIHSICLSSCSLDVLINVAIIYFVRRSFSSPTPSVAQLYFLHFSIRRSKADSSRYRSPARVAVLITRHPSKRSR